MLVVAGDNIGLIALQKEHYKMARSLKRTTLCPKVAEIVHHDNGIDGKLLMRAIGMYYWLK